MQRIRDEGERCTSKRLQVVQECETPICQGKVSRRGGPRGQEESSQVSFHLRAVGE